MRIHMNPCTHKQTTESNQTSKCQQAGQTKINKLSEVLLEHTGRTALQLPKQQISLDCKDLPEAASFLRITLKLHLFFNLWNIAFLRYSFHLLPFTLVNNNTANTIVASLCDLNWIKATFVDIVYSWVILHQPVRSPRIPWTYIYFQIYSMSVIQS